MTKSDSNEGPQCLHPLLMEHNCCAEGKTASHRARAGPLPHEVAAHEVRFRLGPCRHTARTPPLLSQMHLLAS